MVVGKEKSLQLKLLWFGLVWFSDRKRREGDLRVEVVVVITGSFSCGMCAKAIIRSRGSEKTDTLFYELTSCVKDWRSDTLCY